MNLLDFTTSEYNQLISALSESDWKVLTVREYLDVGPPFPPYIVVRHDVDRRVEHALTMAEIEAEHDIASTYYFRTSTFDEEVVQAVEKQGHEVGYHYEDLAKTRGDLEAARHRFIQNLATFRKHVDVKTVCAHGSPLSTQQNLDLWRDATDHLADYDLLGEAYLSIDVAPDSDLHYLSDTSRTWNDNPSTVGAVSTVRTTDDLIDVIWSGACTELYILAHPSRWARSRLELAESAAWDVSAEVAMSAVGRIHGLLS